MIRSSHSPLAHLALLLSVALIPACSGNELENAIEEKIEEKCMELAKETTSRPNPKALPSTTRWGHTKTAATGTPPSGYYRGTSTGGPSAKERKEAAQKRRKEAREREAEANRLADLQHEEEFDELRRLNRKECQKMVEEIVEISTEIDPEGTLEVVKDWDADFSFDQAREELIEDLIDLLEDGA
jgi:hypothetical protein